MRSVAIVDGGYKSYEIEERALAEADAGAEFISTADLAGAMPDCEGMLVRQSIIDRALMSSLKSLKVVARYGVRVDNVDLEAATDLGVVVTNTPGFADEEVSTHAAALFLAAARFIPSHHDAVKRGEWDVAARYETRRLRGRVMGLLGFGGIARCAAPKFKGLGLKVTAYDPYLDDDVFEKAGVQRVDLDTLLSQSDYISVHAPSTPETHHILNDEAFAGMKHGVIIVNTSRGPLIDEGALARAVESGRVAAAGLDVFETEPLPEDSPLRKVDRVVLSDHAAWYSVDSLAQMQTMAAESVRDVLLGRKPEHAVNPDVLGKLELE